MTALKLRRELLLSHMTVSQAFSYPKSRCASRGNRRLASCFLLRPLQDLAGLISGGVPQAARSPGRTPVASSARRPPVMRTLLPRDSCDPHHLRPSGCAPGEDPGARGPHGEAALGSGGGDRPHPGGVCGESTAEGRGRRAGRPELGSAIEQQKEGGAGRLSVLLLGGELLRHARSTAMWPWP